MIESSSRKIKVVVAMPGLDCHDRGIIYLSHVLREAGMEVIYLGKFNTPEQIVNSAIDEDVDAIALSYLNDHLYMIFFPKVDLRSRGTGWRASDGPKASIEFGYARHKR